MGEQRPPSQLMVCEAMVQFCRREYGRFRPNQERRVLRAMAEVGPTGEFRPGELAEAGATTLPWSLLLARLTAEEKRICYRGAQVIASGGGCKPITPQLATRIEQLFGPDTYPPEVLDPWGGPHESRGGIAFSAEPEDSP